MSNKYAYVNILHYLHTALLLFFVFFVSFVSHIRNIECNAIYVRQIPGPVIFSVKPNKLRLKMLRGYNSAKSKCHCYDVVFQATLRKRALSPAHLTVSSVSGPTGHAAASPVAAGSKFAPSG